MNFVMSLLVGLVIGFALATYLALREKKKLPSPVANSSFSDASAWIPPNSSLWQPALVWKITYIISLGEIKTSFDTITGEGDIWSALKVFINNHKTQDYFIMSVEELTPINNG